MTYIDRLATMSHPLLFACALQAGAALLWCTAWFPCLCRCTYRTRLVMFRDLTNQLHVGRQVAEL